jgi:hypothetical protein
MNLKNTIRSLIPEKFRLLLWSLMPKFHLMNTYRLEAPVLKGLIPIDPGFEIREISERDDEKLIKAYYYQGRKAYINKVPSRMNSGAWKGLAIFDKATGDIAYIAWIVIKSIRYLEEFGVRLEKNQYLLKDGFCVPEYRHKGLHTRMECERINYCVNNGAKKIFIQIHGW